MGPVLDAVLISKFRIEELSHVGSVGQKMESRRCLWSFAARHLTQHDCIPILSKPNHLNRSLGRNLAGDCAKHRRIPRQTLESSLCLESIAL